MALKPPVSVNYAATIIKVPATVDLPGLDNLVGVPVFGFQALTQRAGVQHGDLRVLFVAGTQLSEEYARWNNLHRDPELNQEKTEKGYLEKNRRIRAMKMRGHVSNALLMPLESLSFTGVDISTLSVGDTFDTLNGHPICRKYVQPGSQRKPQVAGVKASKQVDERLFPRHVDTEHLFRNLHHLRVPKRTVTTQKLHGTSFRAGHVPVARNKGWFERVVINKWLRMPTADTEFKHVYGSRNVVKGRADNQHYYDSDVWSEYGQKLDGMIPEGMIIYGELVGWVDEQTPIQKNYTYHLPPGQRELYVYRVAVINSQGVMVDLPWEGVEDVCLNLGLKTVPVLDFGNMLVFDDADGFTEAQFVSEFTERWLNRRLRDDLEPDALPLSDPKTVDEGVCVRIEGMVPRLLKAKSSLFFEHESRLLDANIVDVETTA